MPHVALDANRPSPKRRPALVALLACAAGVVGVSPDAGASPIRWHRCGGGLPRALRCGRISVPLDYAHPQGARITIGFNRLRASDPSQRIGSLILNPGGPGGAGSEVIAAQAAGRPLLPAQLRRRFDLIGMDPRGVGTSTPVRCDPALFNAVTSSLFPRSRDGFAQLSAHAAALGESCLRLTGPLLGHVDTRSVARDMEALRRRLGDGKLNFLGLSYGSELGMTYAELYPRRIRVMALDGALEHQVSTTTLYADASRAYEDALRRFAAWCEHTARCPLHGRRVLAFFDRLVRRADRQPIPAPGCARAGCRTPVTGGDIRSNAQGLLLVKGGNRGFGIPSWTEFANALRLADRGDATAFAWPLATSPDDGSYAGLAINCVDHRLGIGRYEDFVNLLDLGRAVAPHLQGAGEAWPALVGCMRWPVPAAFPARAAHVRGAPPILLVNATHDPETPYVWAHGLLGQMPSAVLLTREGDGHTTTLVTGPSRTRDAIVDYLVTGVTPPPNTVLPD